MMLFQKTGKACLAVLLSFLLVFSLWGPTVAQASGGGSAEGGSAGYVTVSVEKFTLGQGYVVEPVRVPFQEGDSAAAVIAQLLGEDRYQYDGSVGSGFYLSGIYDPEAGAVAVPAYIVQAVGGADQIGGRANADWLSAFDYYGQSGWMYVVNNGFPNVGASDKLVENEDVIRWQFTVYGYGKDLGSSYEGDPEPAIVEPASKDELTREVAEINSRSDKQDILADADVRSAYDDAYAALIDMESSQSAVNAALSDLRDAWKGSGDEVSKTALENAVASAILNAGSVKVSADGTDVPTAEFWVTEAEWQALTAVIVAAQQLIADLNAVQDDVDAKVLALDQAEGSFHSAKKPGLLEEVAEPVYNAAFTVSPATMQLELYDAEERLVDIGEGVNGAYKVYNALLPAGEYRYRGVDSNGNSIGGGRLTITTEPNQSFGFRQLNLKASNAGWTAGIDYTARIAQSNPEDTSLSLGTITSAGQYPVLVLTGNTYFYYLEPSAARQDEGFVALSSIATVTLSSTALNQNAAIRASREIVFTVPEGAELFVGRKFKHFIIFEQTMPLATKAEGGKQVSTFKLMDGQEYNYRVSQSGKLTNTGIFSANQANEKIEITEAELNLHLPTAILNRGTHLEGNIYLNVNEQNHLKLAAPGDEFMLLNMRSWQAVNNITANYFVEPDFHYEIVAGHDVVEITAGEPGGYSTVRGLQNGTAIVKVTYDAIKLKNAAYAANPGDAFGASWPENAGLFVVTVGQDATGIVTGIESNKERNRQANEGKSGADVMNLQNGIFDADIDSLYYLDTEPGALYTFTPSIGSAVSVLRPDIDHDSGIVSYGVGEFSTEQVASHEDGSFSVLLTEGRNIVKIERDGLAEYQVMTARPLRVIVNNVTSPGQAVEPGDQVQVVFEGLSHPAIKLSGIYNFSAQLRFFGGPERTLLTGAANQYTFIAAANSITFKVPETLEGNYSLDDGHIKISGYGSPLGDHRNIDPLVGANPNFTALIREGYYSFFPTIRIIEIDKSALQLAIEEASQLLASVVASIDGTDVPLDAYWVPEEAYSQLVAVIEDAQALIVDENAGKDEVDAKTLALDQAGELLDNAKQWGVKKSPLDVSESLNAHLAYLVASVDNPAFGTAGGEWTIISLARSGYEVPTAYFETYYNNVVHAIQGLMPQAGSKPEGRLDNNKGTEHSRLILGLTAIGRDIADVAGYHIGAALADFDYVVKQGINGPIFALLALDSYRYDVPAQIGVPNPTTRDKLIGNILDHEIAGGGWSLAGGADPDITAMALQALAPYYDDNGAVKAAADRAIAWLSSVQTASGGYASGGNENAHSVAQVIVALTSLGIDPHTDLRFNKNRHSALDNLLSYETPTGGFVHPQGGSVDGMATDQGTYALVAYARFQNGETGLYDMSDVTLIEAGVNETVPLPNDGEPLVIPGDAKDYTIRVKESDSGKQVAIELPEATQAKAFVHLPSNVALPNLTFTRADVTVEFPQGLALQGATNQMLEMITSKNKRDAALQTSLIALIDESRQLDAVHEYVAIGAEGPIQFANGYVAITFKDMKGKDVAFVQNGEAAVIEKFADDQEGLNSGKQEYAYEVGNDLIVKTNHFTDFAVYSTKVKENQGGGDNGSGTEKATIQLSIDKLTIQKGYVLSPTTVSFTPGESVWDVLKRELDARSITYSYSFTPRYDSIYVESIAGDGEFDHGSGSGWMFNVNGVYPNYGASNYKLKQNDRVQWRYTTNLGIDLGQNPSEWEGNPEAGSKTELVVDASDANPVIEVPQGQKGVFVVKVTEQAGKANQITINIAEDEAEVWLDLGAVKEHIPFIEVNKGNKQLVIEKGTKLVAGQERIKLFAPRDDQLHRLAKLINDTLVDETASIADIFEMGNSSEATVFSQSVTLTLQGAGNRRIGLLDHRGEWTPIGVYSTDEAGRATGEGSELLYAFVEGDDLIVKTTHFSAFVLYETAPATNPADALAKVYADSADVASWANELVWAATEKGFVEGYNGKLYPKKEINRAEFAKLLVEVFGLEPVGATKHSFKDVAQGSWYASYVNAAFAAGVVTGYKDSFKPDDTITREEMAAMVARALGAGATQAEAVFRDGDRIAPWAQSHVAQLAGLNIMSGYEGSFNPADTATREMAFVVAMRAYLYKQSKEKK